MKRIRKYKRKGEKPTKYTMRFYLIRHGDPEYATDSLTQHGRMQAEAIATYLTAYHGLGTKRHKVGVVSSPMGRARETAAPTARALVNGVAEVENWLEEKNWRVPAVNLWKGDEGHEARQHKVDKEVDMDGAEEDAGVAEVARKKKGTMAVWDVPAKILRDPVTSEDDQVPCTYIYTCVCVCVCVDRNISA